jgi:hypothetical protein
MYLVVVPRPLPAVLLVVHRKHSAVVPKPLPGRGAATLSQQERNNSADMQRSKVNVTGFIFTVAR